MLTVLVNHLRIRVHTNIFSNRDRGTAGVPMETHMIDRRPIGDPRCLIKTDMPHRNPKLLNRLVFNEACRLQRILSVFAQALCSLLGPQSDMLVSDGFPIR